MSKIKTKTTTIKNCQQIPVKELFFTKESPHSLLVGMQTGITILKISVVNHQKQTNKNQKLKINLPYDSSDGTSWHMPNGLNTYSTDARSAMLISALFTVTRKWKQFNCPSTDESMTKMCCIYTMEYKTLVENETIKFSSKCVYLEKSSEVTQSQKNKQLIFSDI